MNLSIKRFLPAVFVGAALCSCAFKSQIVALNPAPPVVNPTQAHAADREVVLVTSDARVSREIGRRTSGSGQPATITTDTDIAALLQARMTDILKAKGYRVVSTGPSTLPTLELHLKELSYVAFTADKERKVKIQVALEAIVKNGGQPFRTTLHAEQERRVVLEPVAKSNEEWINEAFALALKEVAEDARIYSQLE